LYCHPERSEGSSKRFFVAALLRMTNVILSEAKDLASKDFASKDLT
jgi:hypothetical protein